MQKFVLAAKCLIVFLAVLIIVGCSCYKYQISPIGTNTEKKEIIVEEGDTWYSVGNVLKENNLIRSTNFYKIYIKLFTPDMIEAGKYFLSEDMSLDDIVKTLEDGSEYNLDDVSVTFKEGLNMRSIARIISNNTNNTEDDVFNTLSNTEYLDSIIEKYWFLTDDIKNTSIYYSLEGYLFPETYVLNKKNSVQEIFNLMLDQMDIELSKYKTDIDNSNFSIHELLTLSSIVELEAGNSTDRASVAGVFYNRISQGVTLGSDVTAYYAYKMDDWSNGLTMSQINGCNAYNTRGTCVSALPVGPICNPGEESIKATLEPVITDNFFFVADCDGNTYLTKTNAEHEAMVAKLKNENKWCDQ